MTEENMNNREELKKFLWELTQLSHKYGIGIEDGILYRMDTEDPYNDKYKGYTTIGNRRLLFIDNIYS
ncbi:MAG: hypothetical protein LBQ13_00580 [Endomicrobium sp.]|jgi:hypothetical protein|nr:hypothetical protein [Endomicrobium sp.]